MLGMTLKKKTLGIIGLTLVTAITLLAFISQQIVLNGFKQQENQETSEGVERAQKALDNNLKALEGSTRDWALWPDSYSYIQDHNQAFVVENLVDNAPFVSLQLNLLLYIDMQTHIVFSKTLDYSTGKNLSLPAGLKKHIYPGSPLLNHDNPNSSIKGIIALPEGFMLVASEPIVPSPDDLPVRGTLIFGRFLDKDVVQHLSELTLLDMSLQPVDDPKMSEDFKEALAALTAESPITVQPLDSEVVAGYSMLNDIYGRPALLLRIETNRDIYQQGQHIIGYFIFVLITGGILCLLMITLLLDKLVLVRLARLKSDVSNIGVSSDAASRIAVVGNDELSSVADSINGMLSALQLSREEQKQGEERFSKAFNATPAIEASTTMKDWRIIDVNDAFVQVLGYTREEVIGRSALELNIVDASRFGVSHPEGAPGQEPPLDAASGEADPGTDPPQDQEAPIRNFEVKVKKKSGESLTLLYSEDSLEVGGEMFRLSAAIDITERKHAEELRFSKAFTSNPAIQLLTSMVDHRIIAVNEAFVRQSGYSQDEAVGRTAIELNLWTDLTQRDAVTQSLQEQGEAKNMEISSSTKSGQARTLLYSAVLLEVDSVPCLLSTALDISDRKAAEQRNQRQLGRLAALRNIDMAIMSSLDLRLTLNVLIDQATAHLNVDAAALYLLNPHTQMLDYATGHGFHTSVISGMQVRMGQGYTGRAALERRTIHVDNLAKADGNSTRALHTSELFVTYYATPLIAKGQVKGVLEVYHRAPLDPDSEWLDFLETLAGQAAIAIDSSSMFDDLQRSNTELPLAYDTTLEGWSRALDLRDNETEGHTQRVTQMAVKLARFMGFDEERLVHVRRGSLLHDIGKMGIPDSILLKPGPLTDEEWVIMRRHPQYAYDMLLPVAFLHLAVDIPRYHHEKWDGSGYPTGLKGEQIPLAARIFAIVDVWDALRSDRPYRAAWPDEKVREHIRALSGTHFDPRVVEAFMAVEMGVSQPKSVLTSWLASGSLAEIQQR
jgi:PAS domain S-box-containing protein